MNTLRYISTLGFLAFLPVIASAQSFPSDGGGFGALLGELITFTNDVLIPFILGIGFLVFVWGMFRYFIAGGADEDARANGKNLMIYATLAFVLIIIFWGVVNLLAGSTGFGDQNLDPVLIPSAAPITAGGAGGG